MTEECPLAVPVRFHRTAAGVEPALEWLPA